MKNTVILVPAYQCEATITDTLLSIEAQGPALARIHSVIVADDKSTDRTREVARTVWKGPIPLTVIDPDRNRGEYVNVNEAVAAFPEGIEWFLILHGDNAAKPGWLDALLDAAKDAPPRLATVCASWDDFFSDDPAWERSPSGIPALKSGLPVKPGENLPDVPMRLIPGTPDSVRGSLMKGCWWHISCCIIRRKAYQAVGGLPSGMRLKGDEDFLLRLLRSGWDVGYIPKTLMLYRTNPLGSSSLTFRRHFDIREGLLLMYRHLPTLSDGDLTRLHLRSLSFLFRRFARALQKRDWQRIAASPRAFSWIVSSLFNLRRARCGIKDATTAISAIPAPHAEFPAWLDVPKP